LVLFFLIEKIPTHEVQLWHYQLLLSPKVKRKSDASAHINAEAVGKKSEKRLHRGIA
jgi:hypothetical protein